MYPFRTGGYGSVYLVWYPHRNLCLSRVSGGFSGKVRTVGAGVLCAYSVHPGGDTDTSVYNYVGISMGSILAFVLSKRYGKSFVQHMIGEKNYKKYIGWLDKGTAFDKAFAAAIFFPVAPDDLLCYIAGLTKMTLRKFTLIIILGKPGSIFLYSLGLTSITQLIQHFL